MDKSEQNDRRAPSPAVVSVGGRRWRAPQVIASVVAESRAKPPVGPPQITYLSAAVTPGKRILD